MAKERRAVGGRVGASAQQLTAGEHDFKAQHRVCGAAVGAGAHAEAALGRGTSHGGLQAREGSVEGCAEPLGLECFVQFRPGHATFHGDVHVLFIDLGDAVEP